jgi:hypothetical protein
MMGAGRFVFSSSSVALRSSKENKTTVEMKQKDKKTTKQSFNSFFTILHSIRVKMVFQYQ